MESIMPSWFYTDAGGTKRGPLSEHQIQSLVRNGVIIPTTLMETDGGKQGRAWQIPGLFATPQVSKGEISSFDTSRLTDTFPNKSGNKASKTLLTIGIVVGSLVGAGLLFFVLIFFFQNMFDSNSKSSSNIVPAVVPVVPSGSPSVDYATLMKERENRDLGRVNK